MRALLHRIGRRGSALLMFAFVDAVYAYSLFNPAASQKQAPTMAFMANVAPLWFWGLLWACAGAACLIGAFRRSDRWAFACAMAIKVLWGLLFVWAACAGVPRAYVSAALWLAIAGWVGVISTWPESPARR